jgi:hypothetical protein
MIVPSLVLVRSSKRLHFCLTQKRSLKIGTDESADIIVNDPRLDEQPEVLGPESEPDEPHLKGKGGFHFFPSYSWHLDGIRIRMIKLNSFFSNLIPCFAVLFLIILLKDPFTPFEVQAWTPVRLPAEGIYGFCRQDQSHREGVRFSFEAKVAQPYRLFFLAGGEGGGAVITFSLNGIPVGNSLDLPSGWGEETFIPLPTDSVKNGINILEVRPRSPSMEWPRWGISKVRAAPTGSPESSVPDTSVLGPESILTALGKSEIPGRELAHYYEMVKSWDPLSPTGISSHDRRLIMNNIEEKMRDLLHHVAFEVHSRRIQRDFSAVHQLLDDTRGWIPKGWVEGWKIYDDLSR